MGAERQGCVKSTEQEAKGTPSSWTQQQWEAWGRSADDEIVKPTKPQFRGVAQEWGQGRSGVVVMPKLMIGQPNDQYEQEADRVAQQVVQRLNAPPQEGRSQSDQTLQREGLSDDVGDLQRLPMGQSGEAIGGGEASPDMAADITSARGSGQLLESGLQQAMGQAMGADFSEVRVHTDAQADQLNRSIQAKAFTTGQDVFFRRGAYEPGSRGGQELIAHELAHVVQQNSGPLGASDLHGSQTIRRKIAIKGVEVGPEAVGNEAIDTAVSDPYLRAYETEEEMASHLVKKERVAVGLNKSRALWYRIPELGTGEFFVYGESHAGVKAVHLKEESNIKAPIVYEGIAGGLWNQDEVKKVDGPGPDVGMESDAAKLLYGLQGMGCSILWELMAASPSAPGGSATTAPEPKPAIGEREKEYGTYRLVVGDGKGGKQFWDDEGEKETRKRRNSGVEWKATDDMSAALKELWPKLVEQATAKKVLVKGEAWPGKAAKEAYEEWWLAAEKKGLLAKEWDDIKEFGEGGKPVFMEQAYKLLVYPMLVALNALTQDDLAELGKRQKNAGVPGDIAMQPGVGTGKLTGENMFRMRDEFMFESIRKAKDQGYAFAALGAGHGRNIRERLEKGKIPYIGPEEFYEKLSVNALDDATIKGKKDED